LIEDMVRQIAASEGRFADLVEKVVTSTQFRYHRVTGYGRVTSPGSE
jgi:hypothetical protein